MTILVVVILLVLLAIWKDNRTFHKRIRTFELKARDYIGMYDDVLDFIVNGRKEDPDIKFLDWVGMAYTVKVTSDDTEKKFYVLMQGLGEDVLESYEEIGDRYMEKLDEETYNYIEELYKYVLNMYSKTRYQNWLLK